MNRTTYPVRVVIFALISVPVFAQTQNATEQSSLLDLLKPGQVVTITESPVGYKIELLTTQQVEKEIKSRQDNPERRNSRFTPQQSFGISHPVIKSVARDYVTFLFDVPGILHHERHIAIRSIVEVHSYDHPKTDDVDATTGNLPEKRKNGKP
jgi:hypothetical protein